MTQEPFDPLWVPILSHYRDVDGESRLDRSRVQRHLAWLRPGVRQYLIAGTTGDGWGMPDAILRQWLELASDPGVMGPPQSFIVGAFGADTAAVVARAETIERHFNDQPSIANFAGLTLCPPVSPGATQAAIATHFRDVIAATSVPIAIYQLPQVTGCEISPELFAELADENPRITLFKDTSGADRVAKAGLSTGRAKLLRGAEGGYSQHLAPAGAYDGWLLSTANGFGAELRSIVDAARGGEVERADAESERLTRLVENLFAKAAELGGNAFADANRGVDHIRAFGAGWRSAPPPLRADGSSLPAAFLAFVDERLALSGVVSGGGYMRA